MEVRPIDANAAIQAIKDIYCKECNSYNGVRCRACNFDDAMSVIDDAPTLDYAPVRHGSVIETNVNGKSHRIFSCCGTDFTTLTMWMIPIYCPCCGALMDRKEDADENA